MEDNGENEQLQKEKQQVARDILKADFNLHSLGGCQHCYCGHGTWNGREHIVCCICGHRTLANPVSY